MTIKNFYGILCVDKVSEMIISVNGVLNKSFEQIEQDCEALNKTLTEEDHFYYKPKKFMITEGT